MQFANYEPRALDLDLPWQDNPEQEQRFKKLLTAALVVITLFAVTIPWLPIFESDVAPEDKVTRTKVVLDPIQPEPEPQPQPQPVVEPPPPAPKPQPKPEPQPESRAIAERPPAPPPKAEPPDRESVMRDAGLANLSNQLNAMRGSVSVAKLQRKNVSKSELGKQEYSTRDKFGVNVAAQRSQGVQTDQVVRQDNVSLSDYRGVPVQATTYSDDPGGSQISYLSGQAGSRDMESIRRTFEAAKSRVYALYLQALNQNPQLAGKFIFRLVIEPDGTVSELELVNSELGLRDLENTILERIRGINFGAKEVSPTAVEYAFSFLPS
ncbi:AgmX/PglI C-terminal domain-containing protein [Proteobacteria bacterium 005FR1]|nr:AgmX/PglI C-terminal domain-containing protein [Proteobacteria bacterium 005FR1]